MHWTPSSSLFRPHPLTSSVKANDVPPPLEPSMTTPAAPLALKRSGDDVDDSAATSKRFKGTGNADVALISSE